MILPLSHDRMTLQRLPWVTIGIIFVNVVVFLGTWPAAKAQYELLDDYVLDIEDYVMSHPSLLEEEVCEACPEHLELEAMLSEWSARQGEHLYSRYGYVPAQPRVAGLFGSLFLHAGWAHLFGNMYFLWLCGCSIEDIWGRPVFAAVYLFGGAGAALTHAAFQPDSVAHLVGASGAIAALMGIFCIRCWNARIQFFYIFVAVFGTFTAPAWIMLLLWLGRELASAFVSAGASTVALWAHIGGFGLGAAVAFGMKLAGVEEKFIAPSIDRKTNLAAKHPKLASAIDHFDRGDYHDAVADLRIAIQEDRDDPDLYHLLAQCHQALGRPAEEARWLRQELAIHLRRRDFDIAVSTYEELMELAPDAELTPRELFPLAAAFARLEHETRARRLFEKVLATASDPLLRLRSALALADLLGREGRPREGLELLDRAEGLVGGELEWKALLEDKRRELRRSGSFPAPLSES